ncbi:hypothetical protein [Tuwongella immobilis]|uniref:Uncharacterized protein n=1 Tax=Tuwongella immobilis TaxID=692036 RepID=A0A6C2YV89_9BACT|nr:hypothetical protein [Tuwongella immobilis]VIP05658.1 Uncharacterized protein OS=Singulisphaera acidiphila (strain ATCC BAA-1392 / DSM 18658 / VKM B-2454 / MOB10) GN=Sinac_5817 PE=4 SV=1 [Tuwongella immobilis]VTS08672.1 Uncharacterized protein OS=Singulisphaera acidiphila (strain ATCC BAA-1392 / DSM 18658 / VKM B-2454 / MOB10) GN=Sinac_5817 PE=4 SV=1 [Tuwongella immobilis]
MKFTRLFSWGHRRANERSRTAPVAAPVGDPGADLGAEPSEASAASLACATATAEGIRSRSRDRSRGQSRFRARARRLLTIAGAGYLLWVAWGFWLLEWHAPALRDPEFGVRLERLQHQHRQNPHCPIWLILGSSRSQMGLSPTAMMTTPMDPLVINFGIAGAGPQQQWLTLERLLESGVRPSGILLEILPAFLHNDAPMEAQLPIARLSYADRQRLADDFGDPQAVAQRWWLQRLAPMAAVRGAVLSRFAPYWLPYAGRLDGHWRVDAFGWNAYPQATIPEAERDSRTQKAIADYQPNWADFRRSPGPDRALHRLLQRCQELQIPVVLFRMPESPRFQAAAPSAFAGQADAEIAAIRREFPMPFVDALHWQPMDAAYLDGHHLLPAAAEAVSIRLAEACRTIGGWPRN